MLLGSYGLFCCYFFLTCRRIAKTYKVGYLQTKSLFSRSHWKSWPTETRQDRMSSEQPCVRSERVCPWTECQRMWHSIDTPSVLKHFLLEGGERLGKLTSLGKHGNVQIHKGPMIRLWKQTRKQLLRERRLFHGDCHLCGETPRM